MWLLSECSECFHNDETECYKHLKTGRLENIQKYGFQNMMQYADTAVYMYSSI